MKPNELRIGDPIHDSPVGSGSVTEFTERGYPKVNGIAVVWCSRPDGALYDPHNKQGGSKEGTGILPEGYIAPVRRD